ncbi:MAG: hydantoinase/oxoprolinase family protein [Armatimonadetes bacterium]|nr:hydantoinase/oxoprolinase family protein [Armatimonadota bacterium]
MIRVGVDTGGTFTDFVVAGEDGLSVFKVPSTPARPALALLEGLRRAGPLSREDGGGDGFSLLHGTTVATNAILERKLAKTAFVTNEGFRDLLFLGRQTRPEIYDLEPVLPRPPVDPEDCFTVRGRLLPSGEELEPLSNEGLEKLASELSDYESVAVCLLFAYANPRHERRVVEALSNPFVCCSHEVSPEFREYERACATVLNAAVGPIMRGYLKEIAAESGALETLVMSSAGGLTTLEEALELPIRTVTSGPAGGVAATHDLGRRHGRARLIAFDMGGTSTDVSLISGVPAFTSLSDIAGLPVRGHRVDVHTIGCGGGSIAHLDDAGALRVGPESAGAEPGPAVYGKGGPLTVTDADYLLGRLPLERFGGGSPFRLDTDALRRVVPAFAGALGRNEIEVAEAVVEVAEAQMARAIRRVSSERGLDPAGFALVCYGGAAGMHACAIAEQLGMREVLVPPVPGVFSAMGLLLAPRIHEASVTVLGAHGPAEWRKVFAELEEEARRRLGVPADRVVLHADMRYKGQSHEISVPLNAATGGLTPSTRGVLRELTPLNSAEESLNNLIVEGSLIGYEEACAAFERLHRERYGVAGHGTEFEWTTARVRVEADAPGTLPRGGAGMQPSSLRRPVGPTLLSGDVMRDRSVAPTARLRWDGRWADAALRAREDLRPGERLAGAAIVVQADSTLVIPPGWGGEVLDDGTLSLSPD